jgi:hypothetical protein
VPSIELAPATLVPPLTGVKSIAVLLEPLPKPAAANLPAKAVVDWVQLAEPVAVKVEPDLTARSASLTCWVLTHAAPTVPSSETPTVRAAKSTWAVLVPTIHWRTASVSTP